jgi:predicted nicotinamide N-methyase
MRVMPYPTTLHKIFDDLELYIPIPEKVKPAYENLLAANPQTPFPFWAKTWPSAYELASFLRDEPQWIAGKKVLELGAGSALPSFAIAQAASGMIVSDHSAEAVELMEKNIAHLGLHHVKAMQLDWNDLPENISADVLLLSDINYDSGQFDPLLQLINRFLENGTIVLLATPQRINITSFAEALEPFIKRSVLKSEIRILILGR